jgi:hypothetical protein
MFDIQTYFIPFNYFKRDRRKIHRASSISRNSLPIVVGRKLGSGLYGVVYESNKYNRVLKVSFAESDSGYIAFIKELSKLRRENPYLPTIFSATFYVYADVTLFVVEMERLNKLKRSYYRYNRSTEKYEPTNESGIIVDYFDMSPDAEEQEQKPNQRKENWILRGDRELQFAAKFLRDTARKYECEWDVHDDNVMIRKEGYPVINDPFNYSQTVATKNEI